MVFDTAFEKLTFLQQFPISTYSAPCREYSFIPGKCKPVPIYTYV